MTRVHKDVLSYLAASFLVYEKLGRILVELKKLTGGVYLKAGVIFQLLTLQVQSDYLAAF